MAKGKRAQGAKLANRSAAEISASVRKFELVTDLIKVAVRAGAVVLCVWVIMKGLADLGRLDKGAIGALARVVSALKVSEIVAYAAGAGGFVAWGYERRGKKRAIAKLGEMRHRLEARDAYKGRSGLTTRGDTPRNSEGE